MAVQYNVLNPKKDNPVKEKHLSEYAKLSSLRSDYLDKARSADIIEERNKYAMMAWAVDKVAKKHEEEVISSITEKIRCS